VTALQRDANGAALDVDALEVLRLEDLERVVLRVDDARREEIDAGGVRQRPLADEPRERLHEPEDEPEEEPEVERQRLPRMERQPALERSVAEPRDDDDRDFQTFDEHGFEGRDEGDTIGLYVVGRAQRLNLARERRFEAGDQGIQGAGKPPDLVGFLDFDRCQITRAPDAFGCWVAMGMTLLLSLEACVGSSECRP